MRIDEIKIGKRIRKELGNINELAKSIKDIGLIHPIVINERGELLAGTRRLLAYKKLGWNEIPVKIIPGK